MKIEFGSIVFSILLFSLPSFSITLLESVRTALQNNPKTAANQMRVQAMQDQVRAQWKELIPSLRVSAGYNVNNYNETYDSTSNLTQTRSANAGITTSMNIYDGGAARNSAKAGEASLKAMDARYSSSNARIPNTKGSIASDVVDAYISLIESREQRNYSVSTGQVLQTILSAAATDDEKVLLEQRLNNLKTSLISIDSNIEDFKRTFQYVSTAAAPDLESLQSLDEVIQALVIPSNVQQAINIAMEKSPDLKVADYELESAKYQYQAEKSRLYSPQVDVHASRTNDAGRISGLSERSSTSSIGISVSFTLGASKALKESAAAKSVQASQLDHDGAVEELKYNIESTYPRLKAQEDLYLSQDSNLKSAAAALQAMLDKIQHGEKVDIKIVLSLLDSQSMYWMNALKQKKSIAYIHFNIERTIGTVFENAGLSHGTTTMIQ